MAQLANWAEASHRAREGSPGKRLDIAYGDGPSETLDIFPAAAPGAPVIVYVHGGYWRSLDKSDFSFVAPALVAAGATVVVPNYALCPAVTIEDIALQMVKAVAWTWRHAAEHGANAQRLAVVGHSAGAHLAAMLLSCRWKQVDEDLPLHPLAGALAISGLYDLEPLRHTAFLQSDLKLTPQQVARCSPAFLSAAQGGRQQRQAVRGGRRRRERRVPAPQPAHPRPVGPDRRAGVRDGAGQEPLHRARKPGQSEGPTARPGAAPGRPALTRERATEGCCGAMAHIEALHLRRRQPHAVILTEHGRRTRSTHMALKGSNTERNLKEAFSREAQANRRYLYFAAKADVEGQNDVAALFRSTADGETGHANGHLEFLEDGSGDPTTGLPIGNSRLNLTAAVAGEIHEYTDMYPGMARQAREEGFDEIADWFETLAKAERSHANRYQKALDALTD